MWSRHVCALVAVGAALALGSQAIARDHRQGAAPGSSLVIVADPEAGIVWTGGNPDKLTVAAKCNHRSLRRRRAPLACRTEKEAPRQSPTLAPKPSGFRAMPTALALAHTPLARRIRIA